MAWQAAKHLLPGCAAWWCAPRRCLFIAAFCLWLPHAIGSGARKRASRRLLPLPNVRWRRRIGDHQRRACARCCVVPQTLRNGACAAHALCACFHGKRRRRRMWRRVRARRGTLSCANGQAAAGVICLRGSGCGRRMRGITHGIARIMTAEAAGQRRRRDKTAALCAAASYAPAPLNAVARPSFGCGDMVASCIS